MVRNCFVSTERSSSRDWTIQVLSSDLPGSHTYLAFNPWLKKLCAGVSGHFTHHQLRVCWWIQVNQLLTYDGSSCRCSTSLSSCLTLATQPTKVFSIQSLNQYFKSKWLQYHSLAFKMLPLFVRLIHTAHQFAGVLCHLFCPGLLPVPPFYLNCVWCKVKKPCHMKYTNLSSLSFRTSFVLVWPCTLMARKLTRVLLV